MSEEMQPQAENAENTAQVSAEVPEPKTYKVKVDGVEFNVDETELVNSYQKGRSADKRFQEAAELKKQLETFVENSRSKPAELLTQLGVNPQEFAKQLLLAEIEKEEAAANPDKAEIAALKREVQAIKEGESQRLKELEEKKTKDEENSLVEKIDTGIGQVLEELGVPMGSAPAELISDIAEQMLAEYKSSKKHLEPKEAFTRAKTSFQRRLNAITKGSPKALLELLQPEHLDAIAEVYISKRKPKETPSLKSNTPANHESRDEGSMKQLYDFFKRKS